MGQTLPMDSAPVPPDVRYCSKSDHSRRECEMTLRAMCGQVTAFTAGPGILMLGSQEGSSSYDYVGLDVSQKTTTLCIVDGEGHRQWRGECVTSPEQIVQAASLRRAFSLGFPAGAIATGCCPRRPKYPGVPRILAICKRRRLDSVLRNSRRS